VALLAQASLVDLSGWSTLALGGAFGVAALVIAVAGSRLSHAADVLADRTGLGEAIVGAVLLGGATSLPGILTSVLTAAQGYPELSVSNALGGIAAQTAFLAVADVAYRGANLEHAAASVENLMQSALLATLLAIPLLAASGPEVTVWGLHPASVGVVVFYLFGLRLIRDARSTPYWQPKQTQATEDEDEHETGGSGRPLARLWLGFAGLALVTAVAGYAVAQTGVALSDRTGLSESAVGGLLTAVATSLPELVTSVVAVRAGALTLAVGGVIGGNAFDVLFVAAADVAYREGSIYHAVTDAQTFAVALALVLNGVLLLGLLRRERTGLFGIGFESVLVLALYAGSVALLIAGG
jgi:cation:H+ antiporter